MFLLNFKIPMRTRGQGLLILIMLVFVSLITITTLHLVSGGPALLVVHNAQNSISSKIIIQTALQAIRSDLQTKLDSGSVIDTSYRYPSTLGTYNSASVPNDPANLAGASTTVGQYWGRVLNVKGNYYLVEVTGIVNGAQTTVTEILQMESSVAVRKGIRFIGRAVGDYIGNVTAVGDIDNDSYDDFLIGYKDVNGGRGEVYLIFGRSAASWNSLVDVNGNFSLLNTSNANAMIRFTSRAAGDELGSIARAGDLDHDGYDDLVMGAPEAGGSGRGEVYVIFGRARNDGTTTDWESFPDASGNFSLLNTSWTNKKTIRITHTSTLSLGYALTSGNIDNDGTGYSDLVIGAPLDDAGATTDCGGIFIVFGRSTANWSSLVDASGNYALNAYTKAQFVLRLTGHEANARMGAGLDRNGSGDLDNDGYADIIAGAPRDDFTTTSAFSGSNIFFGRPWENGTSFDWNSITNASGYGTLSSMGGTVGIKIPAVAFTSGNYHLGRSVSSTGDLNNDGYDDVVLGAPRLGSAVPGRVLILFGRPFNNGTAADWESLGTCCGDNEWIDLGTAGVIGISNKVAVLVGDTNSGKTGYDVSTPGDVNNDGIDDLLFGAIEESSAASFAQEGLAYLVSGRSWSNGTTADWDSLLNASASFSLSGSTKSNSIMRFKGEAAWDYLGYWCRGAGDVNGDGVTDFLMDADSASSGKGIVYLIFGRPKAEFDTWVGSDGVFSLTNSL